MDTVLNKLIIHFCENEFPVSYCCTSLICDIILYFDYFGGTHSLWGGGGWGKKAGLKYEIVNQKFASHSYGHWE